MPEFKLSPLMLFILLLLILIVASYYSSWTKPLEGFETTSGNPFRDLPNYTKYYSSLVNVSGNFWYDAKNGNIIKAILNNDNTLRGATVFDRYKTTTSIKFSDTNTKPDTPEKIIKKTTVDKIVKNWWVVDAEEKVQLNYIAVGDKTYLFIFDITNADTRKIKRMMYYENKAKKREFTPTTDNEFSLISEEAYVASFVGFDSYDLTYVKEPLYDNRTRLVYQIMKNIKYDKENGNLLLNFVNSANNGASAGTRTGTTTTTATAGTSTGTTTTSSGASAGTTTTASSGAGTSGFRNIEGFYTDPAAPNAIKVYKRKMDDTKFIATPTNTYTTRVEKTLSSTLDETATIPYFVSDTYGNNTIIYWPNVDTTLVVTIANSSVKGEVPFGFAYFSPEEVSEENEPEPEKQETDTEKEDKENVFDDYTKWSQYMLKTEVVPPVCPACPSCNTGGGGLCMDCGGKGGCGTRSNDGKSLAVKDDGNNIADVKGPSSAAASLGKSAGGAITGTVDAAGNVVGGTVNTVGNVVGGTVNAAANLVSGTIGTAADLLKSTGSGLTGLASSDIRRVGYNQSYQGPNTVGTPGTGAGTNGYNRNNTGIGMVDSVPIDVYSYNGALQSKGSDFRPLTASFSSFSK